MARFRARVRSAWLSSLSLLLAACGASAPPGFDPDGWLECPKLEGVFRVDDPDLLPLVAPFQVPGDRSELYLILTHRPNGTVVAKLRRPARLAESEATLLAMRDARRYRDWRQQVRILQGDEPEPVGVPYGEALAAKLGPYVSSTSELYVEDCDDGWWHIGSLRSLPAHDGSGAPRKVAVRLSANQDGFLMRLIEAKSNDSGIVFFGQGIRYMTYGASEWRRFPRVATDTVDFHIDAPPLADGRSPTSVPARGSLARDTALVRLERHVRATLPAGAKLSILREVKFEPGAIAAPPERMLVELSTTYDGGPDDDPLPAVLAGDPRVVDVEVKRREAMGARSYVLVRFAYDLRP